MDKRAPKRLRTAVACKQCRMAKRRCEGGTPCLVCSSRGIPCESDRVPQVRQESSLANDEGHPPLRFDLPFAAQAIITKLLDRYFEVIAPHWRIVELDDLQQTPYVSPLLLRSICLLSAHLAGPLEKDLVQDIAASIRQCFEAYELLCLPTVASLQSILLLLTSPLFCHSSIMTASACRMALTLGLHRPQYPRPELYWSCIIAARWQSLKVLGEKPPCRLCFDLETTQPQPEPDPNSFFGAIFHLLAWPGWNPNFPQSSASSTSRYLSQTGNTSTSSPLDGNPKMFQLLNILDLYISGGLSKADLAQIETQHSLAFELNPFHEIRRNVMSGNADSG